MTQYLKTFSALVLSLLSLATVQAQTLEQPDRHTIHNITYTQPQCNSDTKELTIDHGLITNDFTYDVCPGTAIIRVPVDVAIDFSGKRANLHVFGQDILLIQNQSSEIIFESAKGQGNKFVFEFH